MRGRELAGELLSYPPLLAGRVGWGRAFIIGTAILRCRLRLVGYDRRQPAEREDKRCAGSDTRRMGAKPTASSKATRSSRSRGSLRRLPEDRDQAQAERGQVPRAGDPAKPSTPPGSTTPSTSPEMAKKRGEEPKAAAGGRCRLSGATMPSSRHGENIVIPKDAGDLVQYEGELVAVIGKQVKHLSREGRASRACSAGRSATTMRRAHLAAAATAPCGAPRTPTPSSRWGRGSRPISTSTRPRRSSASTARSPTISAPTT